LKDTFPEKNFTIHNDESILFLHYSYDELFGSIPV